jgi:plastocyanin
MANIDNAGIVIAVAIVAIALGAAASLGASQDAGPSIPIPKPIIQEKEVEETPKVEKAVEEPMEETVEVEEEVMMEETVEVEEEVTMEEPTGPTTHTVEIPVGTSVPGCEDSNACYLPANITINAGDTVEWPNIDTAAHTVTSGSPAEGPSGVFDSSLLMADATFAFTFEDAGEYDYFCMVHPWMIGSVSVN